MPAVSLFAAAVCSQLSALLCFAGRAPDLRSSRTNQLEALAGEYASHVDQDTPMSFYVEDGKLTVESDRSVPTELKTNSGIEFSIPGTSATVRFTLDSAGRGASAVFSSAPDTVYNRIGPAVHHVFHDYVRTEVMIPMRDGVKLHAVILKPADIETPLPFLMQRTPYGVDGDRPQPRSLHNRPELARDGYIYVAEDIRGRYKSEGKFVMSRPLADHHDPKAVDESTDTYDTVAWLLTNVHG